MPKEPYRMKYCNFCWAKTTLTRISMCIQAVSDEFYCSYGLGNCIKRTWETIFISLAFEDSYAGLRQCRKSLFLMLWYIHVNSDRRLIYLCRLERSGENKRKCTILSSETQCEIIRHTEMNVNQNVCMQNMLFMLMHLHYSGETIQHAERIIWNPHNELFFNCPKQRKNSKLELIKADNERKKIEVLGNKHFAETVWRYPKPVWNTSRALQGAFCRNSDTMTMLTDYPVISPALC